MLIGQTLILPSTERGGCSGHSATQTISFCIPISVGGPVMSDKEPKDYWSECNQIFFHYGKGYGLTDTLQTICLGNEDDIRKFLDTGELSNELNPTQRQVLSGILDYRKEQGIGTTDSRATDMVGAGNNGASRYKPKATRLPTIRKRLPLRPSRTKGKGLSGK